MGRPGPGETPGSGLCEPPHLVAAPEYHDVHHAMGSADVATPMTPVPAHDHPALKYKEAAAHAAVDWIRSGMRVGLGTGSTALHATRRLAELLRSGALTDVTAVATSRATRAEAERLGIPLLDDDLSFELDLTIDGADEVDPELNLIKGGGGALLREKIVAQATRRLIIVVDETKTSARLGERRAVPVEVLEFGWRSQARYLEGLGATVVVREATGGGIYATDSGNMILDCRFGSIVDVRQLAAALTARAGLVEHGLFIGLTHDLIVAGATGVRHLRGAKPWVDPPR
jgi:ribose 5-phosphate isomerase A